MQDKQYHCNATMTNIDMWHAITMCKDFSNLNDEVQHIMNPHIGVARK